MFTETRVPFVVVGAGLAGLACASRLGDQCVLLEKDDRPGGLVRGMNIGEYWFDHVLHLLYFPDMQTEEIVRNMLGDILQPCVPKAWVETLEGVARYPMQMHLRDLDREIAIACIRDLAQATFTPRASEPANFHDHLQGMFGSAMCCAFLFPYNRKLWKRPLESLPPSALAWTVSRPAFEQVLRGALDDHPAFHAYNAAGWYPRPSAGAPIRSMEVLSAALAERIPHLWLAHSLRAVHLEERVLEVFADGETKFVHFEDNCISTIPLPQLLSICHPRPTFFLDAIDAMPHNRAWSVALCIEGPRPSGRGHWRYYADESVSFNRLIYMHEFDPHSSPSGGWGLLAEITERAEERKFDFKTLIDVVTADADRSGAIPADCHVVGAQAWCNDFAYVVPMPDTHRLVDEAKAMLSGYGICPLGRFGRWEYSSMGQVMRDGFVLGAQLQAVNRKRSAL